MADTNSKVADLNPVISVEKNESTAKKTTSKNVTCTKTTTHFLFFIALASIVLSSFITYWITKGMYDRSFEIKPMVNEQSMAVNVSVDESLLEEEPETVSAAELRLPKDLVPIWYNLTLKIYLPGYVDIPANKNMTFEAALVIKFRVDKATDKIVLNSLKLKFPDDLEKIKILQDINVHLPQMWRVRRDMEILENVTSSSPLDTATITEETSVLEEREKVVERNKENFSATSKTNLGNLELPNTTKQQRRKGLKTAADVQVKKIIVNETLEMITFLLDGKLNEGQEYYIQMTYSGPIDNKLAGLYLSQYENEQGEKRFVAVTQMEPTDARRMVPCFDEPQFKAVWKMKVIHPVGTTAISNGIEIKNAEKTDNENWVITSFIESPPMSSYLLGVAVTDFDYNEGTTSRGTRFRIWSRKEAINQTTYALSAGISVLEFYENYYEIPFPLKKQDMVAIPDFAAGAMENWGLITYREKYLLYDKQLYAPYQKAAVALVVAHELAHQWFGNLVTMKWWNDLWLNEGFATFMEYLGADAISNGNFRMTDYFLQDAVQHAYQRDAQATSHPLSFPIDKAEDVSEAFDSITYNKGSAIISMIQQVMGPENFKKGLNNYLNHYKYQNADHDDLWRALNEAVPETLLFWDGEKLDIRDFASKWTQQMGYPVVEVRRIDEKKVELHQKRFKWNENALEREKFRNARFWYKYDIPVWYAVNGEEKPMTWLHESLDLTVEEGDLLVLNVGSKGFYRVNYNLELWLRLTDQLLNDHTEIDVLSRARILDDAFALAEANSISYEIPLNITQYLVNEDEYLPWVMALGGLATIVRNFRDNPEIQHVRDYLKQLITPHYNRIDWEALGTSYWDDHLFFENELQYAIIRQMYEIRDLNCTERLYSIFQRDILSRCQGQNVRSSECSKVPVPIRFQAYCEGVRSGSERVWNEIFDLYKREQVQVERDRLLKALTCSRDPFTLKKLMNLGSDLNDTTIRLQDTPIVFSGVSGEDVGRLIIFDYFQDSWPRIYADLKEQQTLLRRIISSSTSLYSGRQIIEFEAFIKKHRKETSKLDVFGQMLEESRTTKLWRDRNLKALTEWFKKHSVNKDL